jgi:carbonic anhydrase
LIASQGVIAVAVSPIRIPDKAPTGDAGRVIGPPLSEGAGPAGPVTLSDRLGPAEALADLLAGNRRFAAGRPRYGHDVTSPAARTAVHRPYALVAGCLDSRVPPEGVFDQDFGAVVVVRTGGHVLDAAGLGSVEFAVTAFDLSLVVILGHQYCGAVSAAVDAFGSGVQPGGTVGRLVADIAPAVRESANGDPAGLVDRTVDRHVTRTVSVVAELPAVRERVSAGGLAVVGARYQIDTGQVGLLT